MKSMRKEYRRILIVNDDRDVGFSYAPLFAGMGEITESISSFLMTPNLYRLIVFTGGADVSPDLYGDTSPHNMCRTDPKRDAEEKEIFRIALQRGISMIGICRGLQFINVMCGGKLMHHIDSHRSGSHFISMPGSIHDREWPERMEVNSFHHQMVIPPLSSKIIAWADPSLSNQYIGDGDSRLPEWPKIDIEGVLYPEFHCAGVQWHPEAMSAHARGRYVFLSLAVDLLKETSDVLRKKYSTTNDSEKLFG